MAATEVGAEKEREMEKDQETEMGLRKMDTILLTILIADEVTHRLVLVLALISVVEVGQVDHIILYMDKDKGLEAYKVKDLDMDEVYMVGGQATMRTMIEGYRLVPRIRSNPDYIMRPSETQLLRRLNDLRPQM